MFAAFIIFKFRNEWNKLSLKNKVKKSYTIFLLLFLIAPVFSAHAQTFANPTICAPGYIQGNVPMAQVPDYSYTPDGYLELHFRITDAKWRYNFGIDKVYDQNCNLLAGGIGTWSDKQTSTWPGVNHVVLRYAENILGNYYFNAYDGDTESPIILATSTVLWTLHTDGINYSTRPVVRVILGNRSATNFDFSTETGDLISTPALPMRITPRKTPVLIVPGVLGTEINKGSEKLWLDLAHNLTDIGDQFMDPLQFNTNLTPSDTSLAIGEVIREVTMTPSTLVNFNYTKGLIDLFTSQGYTEGTNSDANLFTFPYDWRYGVSGIISATSTNVDLLRQKIQDIMTQTGSNKVDVIAHSTGGLLVKKFAMDHPLDNHIGKAIFVGVPNTGAPKAIKTLLQGDNFGIPWLADGEMKKLVENFPVVYDLSPSQQYFNTKGSYIKIIDQSLSGSTSHDLDFNQANSFLTSDHNLNSQALTNAQNLHTTNFDNFDMRNSGVDLYSIDGCKAGTISKVIERRSKDIFGNIIVSYDQPQETPGDGTVPLESATNVPMDSSHKYYALKADHGKMPSQDGIRQEIVNLISGGSLSVASSLITQDISKCKLDGNAISVFSPLDIEIIDQDGNTAGLIEGSIQNNIPNADFEIMGEHKFVYLPNDEGQTYTIKINGTDTGTFTLREDEIANNQIQQTQIFSDIPVTTNLTGEVNLGIDNSTTTLSLDPNGDGIIDQTIQPSSIIKDTTLPELRIAFSTSTQSIVFSSTDDSNATTMTTSTVYPVLKKGQKSGIATTTLIARDAAGNITNLIYTELFPLSTQSDTVTLHALAYNGATTTLASTVLAYKWSANRNDVYRVFESSLNTSTETLTSSYDSRKNTTTIIPTNQTLPGMVIPYMSTQKGSLIVGY